MQPSTSAESIVDQQLAAFNRRDLEGLLRVYADDAELYEHPASLVAKGTEALRERFELRFREPNLKAALLGRMMMGSMVIDHEEVTRTFPEGPGKVQLTMIWEIKDGRIARAWSIGGPRTLGEATISTAGKVLNQMRDERVRNEAEAARWRGYRTKANPPAMVVLALLIGALAGMVGLAAYLLARPESLRSPLGLVAIPCAAVLWIGVWLAQRRSAAIALAIKDEAPALHEKMRDEGLIR